MTEHNEPMLMTTNDRFILFPIKHNDLWEMYKKSVASFWTSEEIDLTTDIVDWGEKLTDNDRYFISHVLAFFASADGIIQENICATFLCEVQIPEAKSFYAFQIAMESIHNETYSMLIETLIKDQKERIHLFNAINTIPSVAKKAEWALKWITNSKSFAERLVAFACVECLMFAGSFCAIFWLKKRGLMPGLTFSNELISRDESLHVTFACKIYKLLENKLSKERVYEIVKEVLEVEKEFITESLPCSLLGMNAESMITYLEFVADYLLYELGYPKKYLVKNPFDFMDLINLEGKTNFFEKRVSSYQKSGVAMATKVDDSATFTLDAEF